MRKHLNQSSKRAAGAVLSAPAALLVLMASPALAATYQVGQGKAYPSLQDVAPLLEPGDVVEVDGGATYEGDLTFSKSGTRGARITIRGVRKGGHRPVIAGGTNAVHVHADHYVFEGLDITGGAERCLFHEGDDITLRDSVVHDCPKHGILGADEESGSLTLDYVEVYGSGNGTQKHQIYMATDEEAHPGAVFRMQHCYVHDGNGGNNVKSRAERNEIYYNWIEGATYHELELIGPDGADEELAREDSDVVGNVIRKTKPFFAARLGGDGTGQTNGRYRLVNNTFLLVPGSSAALRLFDGIESVEMHNNLFYQEDGAAIYKDTDASWVSGVAISGSGNWVAEGSTSVPGTWKGTLTGADPGFSDLRGFDVRLAADSELIGHGSASVEGSPKHSFPKPLAAPLCLPPLQRVEALGAALQRPASSSRDIGAYSFASGVRSSGAGTADEPTAGDDGAEVTSGAGDHTGEAIGPASGCSLQGRPPPASGGLAMAAMGLVLGLRLRRARGSRSRDRRGLSR